MGRNTPRDKLLGMGVWLYVTAYAICTLVGMGVLMVGIDMCVADHAYGAHVIMGGLALLLAAGILFSVPIARLHGGR
jgi:hypothetical protein